MRIFRTIMLLTGVTVFMPSPPEAVQQNSDAPQAAAATTPQQGLLVTAMQTVSDVASFCARQPDVCHTAGYVAGKLEAKAKYSVRLIYEWANESSGEPQASPLVDQAKSDPITTGSTSKIAAAAPGEGQSTLRIEDLIPEWRGPVSQKKS